MFGGAIYSRSAQTLGKSEQKLLMTPYRPRLRQEKDAFMWQISLIFCIFATYIRDIREHNDCLYSIIGA